MAKKKNYKDMTPAEQQEYRFSDPRGTVINGVLIPDPPDDGDKDAEEAEPPPPRYAPRVIPPAGRTGYSGLGMPPGYAFAWTAVVTYSARRWFKASNVP
jgi:hypothetical protein